MCHKIRTLLIFDLRRVKRHIDVNLKFFDCTLEFTKIW